MNIVREVREIGSVERDGPLLRIQQSHNSIRAVLQLAKEESLGTRHFRFGMEPGAIERLLEKKKALKSCFSFQTSCLILTETIKNSNERVHGKNSYSIINSKRYVLLFSGLKDVARHLREEQNPPVSKNENIKVENGRMPSIPVSKVFRYYSYFPDDFSILITFRAMSLTNIYLVAMYDYRKKLNLGVRITPDLVSFEFEKNPAFPYRRWSLDFAVKVRKEQWHTLGISLQERNVTVFWDCKRIGSKNLQEKFSLIPDSLGEIYVGKPLLASSIERYEVG